MDGVGMNMNHSTHMNEMYFHFSNTVYSLLFKSWNVRSDEDIVGAVVFSFVLAIAYEGLKTVRDYLAWRTHKWLKPPNRNRSRSVNEKSLLMEMNKETTVRFRLLKLWSMRVVLSALRTVEIGMAYILMLLAMTYNGWIFLSVCFGTGTGHLMFIHFRSWNHDSNQEHCG